MDIASENRRGLSTVNGLREHKKRSKKVHEKQKKKQLTLKFTKTADKN
jgi:hypothetical protein